MNFTILLLSFLALIMLLTAGMLIISIRKNFLTGQSFRKEMKRKVEAMRFGEMLKCHGINAQELLHNRNISGIETQLKRCHECVNTSECDRVLKKNRVTEKELGFCPNHASLMQQQ